MTGRERFKEEKGIINEFKEQRATEIKRRKLQTEDSKEDGPWSKLRRKTSRTHATITMEKYKNRTQNMHARAP